MTFKQTLLAGLATVTLFGATATASFAQTAFEEAPLNVGVGIEKAIESARNTLSGEMRVIGADFFDEAGASAYMISFASGDQVIDTLVDATSGKLLGMEAEALTDPVEALELRQEIARASLSVADALEKAPTGEIVSVTLESTTQSVLYNVITKDGAQINYSLIDAASGKVLDEGILPALPMYAEDDYEAGYDGDEEWDDCDDEGHDEDDFFEDDFDDKEHDFDRGPSRR